VKLAVELVGTPPGQAIVPAGVKLTVPFVPVGVTVCVCVPIAEPVKVSAGMAMLGELEAAAALLSVEKTYFVGLVTGTSVDALVMDCAAFVPAGVPALVAEVVSSEPVKVSAGTVPELPAKVGTPPGQAIVSAGTVPPDPVNVGAVTLPVRVAGVPENDGVPTEPVGVAAEPVNAGAATEPVGVMLLAPPVVPTLLFSASVP
jgi:hypothetical protein